MGASLTCNCFAGACEGFTIKRLQCCPDADKKSSRHQGVVYATNNGPQQFVLLSTPFIQIKEWIVLENVPFNTVTLFFADKEGKIRALLHHEPHDVMHRLATDEKSVDLSCDAHLGELVEDLLPPHLRAPIIRFMKDTLDGTFFQLHCLFNTVAKLIRTYPIADYNDRIVAGVMIIGAFTPSFDDQLQQYVLNGPPEQQMATPADTPAPAAEDLPSTRHLGRRNEKRKKPVNTL